MTPLVAGCEAEHKRPSEGWSPLSPLATEIFLAMLHFFVSVSNFQTGGQAWT